MAVNVYVYHSDKNKKISETVSWSKTGSPKVSKIVRSRDENIVFIL